MPAKIGKLGDITGYQILVAIRPDIASPPVGIEGIHYTGPPIRLSLFTFQPIISTKQFDQKISFSQQKIKMRGSCRQGEFQPQTRTIRVLARWPTTAKWNN